MKDNELTIGRRYYFDSTKKEYGIYLGRSLPGGYRFSNEYNPTGYYLTETDGTIEFSRPTNFVLHENQDTIPTADKEQKRRERLKVATAAMQGILAHSMNYMASEPEDVANDAVNCADALLKRLDAKDVDPEDLDKSFNEWLTPKQ